MNENNEDPTLAADLAEMRDELAKLESWTKEQQLPLRHTFALVIYYLELELDMALDQLEEELEDYKDTLCSVAHSLQTLSRNLEILQHRLDPLSPEWGQDPEPWTDKWVRKLTQRCLQARIDHLHQQIDVSEHGLKLE